MVSSRLQRGRFVTIVGSAGIGKTTVGIAVADNLLASYQDGARFVDLAPLKDPRLVPSAVASVLGVAVRSENPYPALISFLKDKQILILLDNCEHVLLAELFVERAAASAGGYELKEEDVPVVTQICRRLDGIALAIELAADRVAAFGVRGVASRLDDRFHLLTHGRRTALPRHQTLAAAFDWSYDLLSETARTVMRRLGAFAGRFSMDSAIAVTGDSEIVASKADEAVADLVEKSLVVADVGGETVYYRLTDTARAYALKKPTEGGEAQAVARLHALHQLDQFERAHSDWGTKPTAGWLSTYTPKVDDLRSALDWAFAPSGDAGVGIALTVAAVPLWFEMSLMEECRACAERALTTLECPSSDDLRLVRRFCEGRLWLFTVRV
jgi:predicted ATPase